MKQTATFKDWTKENLGDYLEDIVNHGAISGFPCITYYSDTNALHDQFEDEIWDALYEDAEEFGQTIPEFIASFNGAKDVGSMVQFKNLLTWYMVERTARELTEN